MGRRLSVVLIDDRHREFKIVVEELRDYAEIICVNGVATTLTTVESLKQQQNPVVDIILCDVNMETDASILPFMLSRGDGTYAISPGFEVNGTKLTGGSPGGGDPIDPSPPFMPYGPILALMFARFFKGGGIIEPISAYWRKRALIDPENGYMNGYVYVALGLIWGIAGDDAQERIQRFSERFSQLYNSASEDQPISMIQDRFRIAVAERRKQLLDRAHSIQGLENLTVETLDEPAVVTIYGADNGQDLIDRRSLFADYRMERTRFALSGDGDSGLAELAADLDAELAGYARALTADAIEGLCKAFVGVISEADTSEGFIKRYSKAHADSCADCLPAISDPNQLPSRLRRYLLLSAQLYLWSVDHQISYDDDLIDEDDPNAKAERKAQEKGSKPPAWNQRVAQALGLKHHTHTLPAFILVDRDKPPGTYDIFEAPFFPHELKGWQGWNISRTDKRAMEEAWAWTDLDRRIAQAVWEELEMDDHASLPHGLGLPVGTS